MLLSNLNEYSIENLYKCGDDEHLILLTAGFEPIYIDDEYYYYLLDSKLEKFIEGGVYQWNS